VFAIERIAELSRRAADVVRRLGFHNAAIKSFDGTIGWSEHAPYDGILVAAGGPTIPEPLLSQLGLQGKLVIPIGDQENQILVRVTKTDEGFKREDLEPCSFVKLIGRYGWSDQRR